MLFIISIVLFGLSSILVAMDRLVCRNQYTPDSTLCHPVLSGDIPSLILCIIASALLILSFVLKKDQRR